MGHDLDHLELVHLIGDDTDEIGPLHGAFGRRKRCRERHDEQYRGRTMQTGGGSEQQRH